jgi:Na+-driven multidrug efflux pump
LDVKQNKSPGEIDMDVVDVTFRRALQIWWSYVWRAFVLVIPIMLVTMPLLFVIMPLPKPGQPNAALPLDQVPALMARATGLWVIMMSLNVIAQVFAMRWMLKTKWRDFRLQAVSDR